MSQMYEPPLRCRNGSTVAIVNCVNAATKVWDRRLNNAYRAALAGVDAGQRTPLQVAQRLWIQYRDANCRFYAAREGSLRDVEAAECMRSMTQQRACESEATNQSGDALAVRCQGRPDPQ